MGILQQASGTFTGTSFTATLPAASSASNLVVVIVAANTTVTTPAGFTLRTSQVNFMGHYLYDRAGGSTSYSFTCASGQGTWYIAEVAAGSYQSALSANNSASGLNYATPSLTPTAGTRTLFASIGSTGAGGVRTVSGWTNSFIEQADVCYSGADNPMQGVAALDNLSASGSTAYSTTATYSSDSVGRSAIIASYITTSGSSDFSGSVALSGSGSLSLASIPTPNGDLALSGSGTLGFSSVPTPLSSLALSGAGALAFIAEPFMPGSLGLGGEGTLSFAADNFVGSLDLSGSGTLSLAGEPFRDSDVTLSGEGVLTFVGLPATPGSVALSGSGVLSFLAQPNETGTLSLSGSGALTLSASPAVLAVVDYGGSGTLAGGSGMTLVPLASIAASSGWTATGGTVLAVLGDTEDSTLITSSDDPTDVLFDGTFGAIVPPSGAFTVRVRTYKASATSGALTGKLYVNTTLKSTVSATIPDVLGNVYLVFPAGDLATITAPDWAAGVRITLAATAT